MVQGIDPRVVQGISKLKGHDVSVGWLYRVVLKGLNGLKAFEWELGGA